jgi:RNA:NAD 2'-phosphotransferase (TPT1/KptA family)
MTNRGPVTLSIDEVERILDLLPRPEAGEDKEITSIRTKVSNREEDLPEASRFLSVSLCRNPMRSELFFERFGWNRSPHLLCGNSTEHTFWIYFAVDGFAAADFCRSRSGELISIRR